MLESEWDTDDRYAEDQATDEVDEGDLPPPEKDPDEVHDGGKAAGLAGAVDELAAEWPEGIAAELYELDAERYADDGYAHQQSYGDVYDGDQKATQNEPGEVSEELHTIRI